MQACPLGAPAPEHTSLEPHLPPPCCPVSGALSVSAAQHVTCGYPFLQAGNCPTTSCCPAASGWRAARTQETGRAAAGTVVHQRWCLPPSAARPPGPHSSCPWAHPSTTPACVGVVNVAWGLPYFAWPVAHRRTPDANVESAGVMAHLLRGKSC